MTKIQAYCLSKKKKVTLDRVIQVWKAKARAKGRFLYLIEGESKECPTHLWKAVGEADAEKIAKEIKKPIKLRVSTKKKKPKKKRKKRKSKK